MTNVKKPHTVALRLTTKQLGALNIYAGQRHLTMSQAIRRILNAYFGYSHIGE